MLFSNPCHCHCRYLHLHRYILQLLFIYFDSHLTGSTFKLKCMLAELYVTFTPCRCTGLVRYTSTTYHLNHICKCRRFICRYCHRCKYFGMFVFSPSKICRFHIRWICVNTFFLIYVLKLCLLDISENDWCWWQIAKCFLHVDRYQLLFVQI